MYGSYPHRAASRVGGAGEADAIFFNVPEPDPLLREIETSLADDINHANRPFFERARKHWSRFSGTHLIKLDGKEIGGANTLKLPTNVHICPKVSKSAVL